MPNMGCMCYNYIQTVMTSPLAGWYSWHDACNISLSLCRSQELDDPGWCHAQSMIIASQVRHMIEGGLEAETETGSLVHVCGIDAMNKFWGTHHLPMMWQHRMHSWEAKAAVLPEEIYASSWDVFRGEGGRREGCKCFRMSTFLL